jgi:hypothetical protein
MGPRLGPTARRHIGATTGMSIGTLTEVRLGASTYCDLVPRGE